MAVMRFTVGDRVKTRIPTPFVRAGTAGTVWRVFASTEKAYRVQFDSHPSPWLMWADELECLDDMPSLREISDQRLEIGTQSLNARD